MHTFRIGIYMKYMYFLMLLLIVNTAYADNTPITCPPVEKVFPSAEHHWGTADGRFRSLSTSHASALAAFRVAQWQGVSVGHVICVYEPKGQHKNFFFPVELYFNDLVYEPLQFKHWQAQSKAHQTYHCVSHHVSDCPFVVRPKPADTDIYKAALELRKNASEDSDAS